MKEQNLLAKVAKVDGTVNTNLMQKYDIEGFPTVLYFLYGEPIVCYERTHEKIMWFLDQMMKKTDIQKLDIEKYNFNNLFEICKNFAFFKTKQKILKKIKIVGKIARRSERGLFQSRYIGN